MANNVREMAKRYSAAPAIYHRGSEEYDELSTIEGGDWIDFLDELATSCMTANYCPIHDTFTIG